MNRKNILIFTIAVGLSLTVGGSSFMSSAVYSSILWSLLWVVCLIALVWSMMASRIWKNIPLFLLHLSFVLIIIGGFCTALFSERGQLHLKPGVEYNSFETESGDKLQLPAVVNLLSFTPEYYAGMTVPKDFRSEVAVGTGDTLHISMNHIGKIGHYRFYQTSFDNEGGSVLTVTHDPWGIGMVYSGFLLFALAGGWILMRRLIDTRRTLILTIFFIGGALSQEISAADVLGTGAIPAVSKERGDSLRYKQVVFNGEVVPFNTVATRLTYKLTGRGDVAGLSPEAFVASIIQYKEEWAKVPFLKIKSAKLRDSLHVNGDYAALSDLYDSTGGYIPGILYEGGRGKIDNDIMALDEKVALLIDLWQGKMFVPLDSSAQSIGNGEGVRPEKRSDFSIRAEVCYNRLFPARVLFMGTITLAMLMLVILTLKGVSASRIWWIIAIWAFLGCACFVWHCLVSAHFPLSATCELMEFTGIIMLIIAAWLGSRRELLLPAALALFAASFLFLVAWIGYKDPVMTPVMPVLASPWLSVHVSLVMVSYALLGMTLPISLLALANRPGREKLTDLTCSLIYPGVYLLGLGIIAGAMWANVSWGRYWAWDPKETWALVTMLLYSIPLHRKVGLHKMPVVFNLYIVLAFAAILMTYFGVNYLPSLHAYR